MFYQHEYTVYVERQPIAGAIVIIWFGCLFLSSVLGDTLIAAAPIIGAVVATIGIVRGRREAERASAEEERRYQQELADYQAWANAIAITRAWRQYQA